MVCDDVEIFPQASVAVQVRVVVYEAPQVAVEIERKVKEHLGIIPKAPAAKGPEEKVHPKK